MERRLNDLESQQEELRIRVDGLEYAFDESLPSLVGILAYQLAKNKIIDLDDFERTIRKTLHPNPSVEDSTGSALNKLADIVSFFRINYKI